MTERVTVAPVIVMIFVLGICPQILDQRGQSGGAGVFETILTYVGVDHFNFVAGRGCAGASAVGQPPGGASHSPARGARRVWPPAWPAPGNMNTAFLPPPSRT